MAVCVAIIPPQTPELQKDEEEKKEEVKQEEEVHEEEKVWEDGEEPDPDARIFVALQQVMEESNVGSSKQSWMLDPKFQPQITSCARHVSTQACKVCSWHNLCLMT